MERLPGVIKSDLAADPPSQLQTGGAYNWLFVAAGGMNMCVRLCLVKTPHTDTELVSAVFLMEKQKQ